MSPREYTGVMLDPDTKHALRMLAASNNMTMGAYIRLVLERDVTRNMAGPLHEDELESCGATPARGDGRACNPNGGLATAIGTVAALPTASEDREESGARRDILPPQDKPSTPSTSPQAGSDPLKPEVSGVGGKNSKRKDAK